MLGNAEQAAEEWSGDLGSPHPPPLMDQQIPPTSAACTGTLRGVLLRRR